MFTSYVITISLMIFTCVKLIKRHMLREVIIGLCLTFYFVPDFMIFDYWKIHISFIFIFLFSYAVPIILAVDKNRNKNGFLFKIFKDQYKYYIFYILILLSALITLIFNREYVAYFYTKIGGFLYTVVLFFVIVSIYRKEIITDIDAYCDIIILAVIAYMFKNFYMTGIQNFRIFYENNFMDLKNMIFASRMLGLGIFLSFFSYLRTKKIIYIVSMLAIFTQMVMFESRGPLIALAVTVIAVLALYLIKKKKQRFKIRSLFVIMSIIVVILFIIRYLFNGGFLDRLIYKYNYFVMNRREARNYLYSDCLDIMFENFPIGVGFGNTYKVLKEFGSSVRYYYPHNLILELFMEDGLLIGFVFFCILLSNFRFCIKCEIDRNSLLFISIYLFSFINSLLSGDIVGNSWVFIIGSFLSCMEGYHVNNKYTEMKENSME